MSSLRESEEKYRALYNNAPLSYQSLDEDGCFIDVNPDWLSTLGYQREEVIGKSFVDFLHPDWKPHFEKNFPDFKRRGYLRDVQFKIRHKDGCYLDISFKGRIGYWPDGSFRQTYCVFQDITERKKAEEELRRSNSILQQERNMFIAGPVVVFKWRNAEGWPVEYVSPNIKNVFGFSAEELTSGEISYAELIPAEDLERVVGEVALNSESGADYIAHQPYRIVRKDGKTIWVDDHTTILRQGNGEVTHYLGYIVDITEQKQAAEALLDSEARYRQLLENVHEIVYSGKFGASVTESPLTFVSAQAAQILGYTPEEFLNDPDLWSSNLHPDDLASGAAEAKKVEQGRATVRLYRMKKKNSAEYCWLEDHMVPQINDSGKVVGFFGVARDITERKRAEEELQRERDRAQRYLDIAGVMILALDSQGNISLLNQRGCEVLGCTKENAVGKNWFDTFLPAETVGEVKETFASLMAGRIENVEFYENIVRTVDGREKLIRWHNSILTDKTGCRVGTLGSGEDITDRECAVRALREREATLRSLFAVAPVGIGLVADRVILRVNKQMCEMVGYTQKELVGQNARIFYPSDEEYEYVGREKYRMIAEEGTGMVETRFQRKNGMIIDVLLSSAPLDPDDLSAGVTFTALDITERKQGREALQEAHDQLEDKIRQRTQQLSRINEDLKREIAERQRAQEQLLDQQGQLRSLASELALTEERERRRFATDLHDSIGQGLAVVKMKLSDLTGCDSPEGGTKILNEAAQLVDQAIANTRSLTFDLSSPVLYRFGLEAAVSFLADQIREQRGLTVTIKESGPEVTLSDDIQVVLFRAVRELLNNVAKHARTDQAQVDVRRTPERIVLQISDAGVGFNPALLSTAGAKIAGFGLFNIRERLHYYGGGLELESAPGQGTRVTLTVPVGQNKEVTKEMGK